MKKICFDCQKELEESSFSAQEWSMKYAYRFCLECARKYSVSVQNGDSLSVRTHSIVTQVSSKELKPKTSDEALLAKIELGQILLEQIRKQSELISSGTLTGVRLLVARDKMNRLLLKVQRLVNKTVHRERSRARVTQKERAQPEAAVKDPSLTFLSVDRKSPKRVSLIYAPMDSELPILSPATDGYTRFVRVHDPKPLEIK